MKNNNDISWDGNNVVYKGVKLDLTKDNIQDYRMQTGMDPIDLIKYTYNNSLIVLRNNKINKILENE
jgi:hypothetical protein